MDVIITHIVQKRYCFFRIWCQAPNLSAGTNNLICQKPENLIKWNRKQKLKPQLSMKESVTRTFGILTSGGDCPGLNAAIRGVCRAAYDRCHMNILGIANGYRGLIDGNVRPLNPEDFSGILTRGGTILGTSREKPFKASEIGEDKVKIIKENYEKYKLDCLVVLGGNGTNTTGYLLSGEGLNILGLPKTIDNDIEVRTGVSASIRR